MKKFLAVLIILLVVAMSGLGLTGCGEIGDSQKTDSEENNTVSLSSAEKHALFEGTFGKEAQEENNTYYGVGRTLNVITDPYITLSSGYSKIFNADKLMAMNWNKTNRGEMISSTVSGNSMEELYSNMNTELKTSFGGSVNFGVFSASLEGKFGNFTGVNYRQTANEIYFSASQTYAATLIEIDEYYDITQFEDILSDEVLSDAMAIQNGTLTPEQFIYKYGTHVVLAGYYGGRVDANYYMQNLGKQWDYTTSVEYQFGVQTKILNLISANANVNGSIKEELGITSNSVTEQFSATSIGGDNFSALTLEDFLSEYKTWAASMNEATEYSNLVGLPTRSLAAIWDLFPSQYSQAKSLLSEYFENEANSASNDFLSKYEKYYNAPDDEGDTTRFGGGTGTEESPYLIQTKKHFENIKTASSPDTYFELVNSIELEIWNNPFEFSGHFDGNGNTITFYQTIASSGNVYGGLFSVLNGADVKNLHLNFNIGEQKGDTTAKIGGLAGKALNAVTISKVTSSGSIILSDGVGTDYIGGIIGEFSSGTIDQCSNSALVESHAWQARTGGIVGYAYASEMPIKISNCYNIGTAQAYTGYVYGGRSAGGIIGQIRGNKSFSLQIINCYNDSTVKTIQEKNAALGWWGCGGLVGDIYNKESSNINISNSYWNSNKADRYGNNASLHAASSAKTNMSGVYTGWAEEIWQFSDSETPKLKWMIE